jgi:hypothetical protein
MSSGSTLVRYCPLRGWFFQRYWEPLSLASKHRLFPHQSCQPAGFQPVRIPGSTNVNCNTATLYEPVPLPSEFCQPFNTHRSSVLRRFSPIRF